MLVAQNDSDSDAEAPYPPLQPAERAAACAQGDSGKGPGWKASRCRHEQGYELFSMDEYKQAVVDFLAATEVWTFPPK
jgi:hypothetical protein